MNLPPLPDDFYHQRAEQLADLLVRKQKAYGRSAERSGAILAILFPDGIPPERFQEALLIVRVLDKLSRIATGAKDEENPWQDVAGYALLALALQASARPENTPNEP